MKKYSPAAVARGVVPVAVKICGITDAVALHTAIENGARYLGFVFAEKSPRALSPARARALIQSLPRPTLCRFVPADRAGEGALVLTALFVDPSDEQVLEVAGALSPCLGLIQLHGAEPPARVAEIKRLTGLPVMKAIAIASEHDLDPVSVYEEVADMILFDAKIDGKSGGTGMAFDWTLLKKVKPRKPWMLAGGLSADNVCAAIEETGASLVDVSSGVETEGKKDPYKILSFLKKVSG